MEYILICACGLAKAFWLLVFTYKSGPCARVRSHVPACLISEGKNMSTIFFNKFKFQITFLFSFYVCINLIKYAITK